MQSLEERYLLMYRTYLKYGTLVHSFVPYMSVYCTDYMRNLQISSKSVADPTIGYLKYRTLRD